MDGRDGDKTGHPDERLYICPRYWDRKHQIPLSPKNEDHPILKIPYDDIDGKKGWKNYIIPHDSTTEELKDSEYFIFERKGLASNKDAIEDASAGYWYTSGGDVNKYNVIFKQNAHPNYPIPCCGKKSSIKKLSVDDDVTLFISEKKIYTARILSVLPDDKYKLKIDDYSGKKDVFHISKLKLRKKTYNYAPFDKFPLFEDENGLVPPLLLNSLKIDFDIKTNDSGLLRRGVKQDNDSFLRCITDKKLKNFKSDLCKDIIGCDDFDKFNYILQLFRNDELSCNLNGTKDNIYKSIKETSLKECKANLVKYINSDEYKDSYILIPIIKCITSNKNRSFDNILNLNIIVFEKLENKMIIQKPIGGFNVSENENFLLILKYNNYYEKISIQNLDEEIDIFSKSEKKIDIKEGLNVLISENYINGTIKQIIDDKIKIDIISDNSEEIFTKKDYDNNYIKPLLFENLIIERITYIINKDKIINRNLYHDFMDYEKVINFMKDYKKTTNEYIDIYNKITHLEFEKNGNLLCLPIRPCDIKMNITKYKKNINIPKHDLKYLIRNLTELDKKINKEEYLSYISDDNKVSKNYYFFENMSFIPITNSDIKENLDFIIDIPLKIQNKSFKNSHLDDYIKKYDDKILETYISEIDYLFYLRRNPKKLNMINSIIENEIMIDFHKREKIYKLMKKYGNKDYLPVFIENLINNGFDKMQDLLINNFSIKDITEENDYEYIFKDFQIKNKEYKVIFEEKKTKSLIIRDISYNIYI